MSNQPDPPPRTALQVLSLRAREMEYRMAMFETAMEPLRQYCEDRANARGDRFHVHELNAVAAEWAAIPANKESVASILVAAALVMIQQNKLNATAEGLTNG